MANGVGLIGLKVRANLPMPKVLILLPLVTTHWIVLVDLMTKIVLILKDAVLKRIGN